MYPQECGRVGERVPVFLISAKSLRSMRPRTTPRCRSRESPRIRTRYWWNRSHRTSGEQVRVDEHTQFSCCRSLSSEVIEERDAAPSLPYRASLPPVIEPRSAANICRSEVGSQEFWHRDRLFPPSPISRAAFFKFKRNRTYAGSWRRLLTESGSSASVPCGLYVEPFGFMACLTFQPRRCAVVEAIPLCLFDFIEERTYAGDRFSRTLLISARILRLRPYSIGCSCRRC